MESFFYRTNPGTEKRVNSSGTYNKIYFKKLNVGGYVGLPCENFQSLAGTFDMFTRSSVGEGGTLILRNRTAAR